MRLTFLLLLVCTVSNAEPVVLRVATFNIHDVRTEDLMRESQPRVDSIVAVLQTLRPNIVLINEIAFDMPGAPDAGDEAGLNARRLADRLRSGVHGLDPLDYDVFAAPSNTGIPSGFDLDNNGDVVSSYPPPVPSSPDGTVPGQSREGRRYGGDCWGFGTFPGQYAMALLVDRRLEIQVEDTRTFQRFPWNYMPGAALPTLGDGTDWYSEDELKYMRLSSKSHWDVPVKLPGGRVLHLLCSHPTPPAFDGSEGRNRRRNHDEIRFWADYIDGASYIVDDNDKGGGLNLAASFVILGDLNADPDEGNSYENAIDLLLKARRVRAEPVPTSDTKVGSLDPDDTSAFGMRVDYVLPSRDIEVVRNGVWRALPPEAATFPSDHFPVWAELRIQGD